MDANALKRIPKNVASITGGAFILNGDTVTGFNAIAEINYGTHGEPVGADIMEDFTAAEKNAVQDVYNAIKRVYTGAVDAALTTEVK